MKIATMGTLMWAGLIVGFFALGMWIGYDKAKLYCMGSLHDGYAIEVQPKEGWDI